MEYLHDAFADAFGAAGDDDDFFLQSQVHVMNLWGDLMLVGKVRRSIYYAAAMPIVITR
jgi:hypothetical protein